MKKLFLVLVLLLNVQFAFAQEPTTDYLIVPSIDLYKSISFEPIINRNYDLTDLGAGVSRADGTIWNDVSWARTVLFGHSNGAFVDLPQVQLGDRIILITDKLELEYYVFDIRVVDPSDISWLNPTQEHELLLMTCYDGVSKRLIVRAKLR